jgi:flagellar biogenesis protein FliO
LETSQDLLLLLRGLLALVAVLALVVITLRFALPWAMRARGGPRPRQISVEEYCPLDQRNRLYVVRWNGLRLLLSSSVEGVRLLVRSEDPKAEGKPVEPRGDQP